MNVNRLIDRALSYLRVMRYGDRPQPQRDWLIVMTVSAALLLAGAGWSYWMFLNPGTAGTASATATSTSVSTASLTTVRTVFEKRAAERARYLTEYHFVDPSR